MKRAFIAIVFPASVKKEIRKIQALLPEFNGKKTELENLHLTLKFLGEIDEKKIEEVKHRLEKVKLNSFDVEIGGVGVFSEKVIRIVWLHLKGAEELQKKIDDCLADLFEKENRFMSHITIARVKRVKEKKIFLDFLGSFKVKEVEFNISKFFLIKSELFPSGAKYSTLKEYDLD